MHVDHLFVVVLPLTKLSDGSSHGGAVRVKVSSSKRTLLAFASSAVAEEYRRAASLESAAVVPLASLAESELSENALVFSSVQHLEQMRKDPKRFPFEKHLVSLHK